MPPPGAIPRFSPSSRSPSTRSISTCASSPLPNPSRSSSGSSPPTIPYWQAAASSTTMARPTRRFWNLKQLAATPPRSFSLPVACDKQPNLTCAAFGNIAEGIYTVHVVNNGATRTATLKGLPPNVKELRLWVTDTQRNMQEADRIPVTDGKAQFPLAATSYTTVIGNP